MKKFLLFLIILCIGGITLLITGCEKEKDVLKATKVALQDGNSVRFKTTFNMYDGTIFDIIITNKGVIYPHITDEYFWNVASGYLTLPSGFTPSLKFKTIILEMMSGFEKEMMDERGFHIIFDDALAKQYESNWGTTMAQQEYEYELSLGIDPSLPQETKNRMMDEIYKEQEKSIELRAPSANAVFNYVPTIMNLTL